MTEDPYSNREIVEMFTDVKDRLIRIESQTTKTNGRVTEIEKRESGKTGASRVWGYIGGTSVTVFLAWAAWVSVHVPR